MSEYQRYEFMTIDQPLTKEQLDAVNDLSSHIEASSTHAVIEYNWGDFKHDPIKVLHKYFDGFLYWANWGSPHLAFRFPHGILPADLLKNYDLDDFVTFHRHPDYDILEIQFGEMEAPDSWPEYTLGPLMPLREELLNGDLRALYIAWLAVRVVMDGYDDEDYEGEDEDASAPPPVPPGFQKLTGAHKTLAELLQLPEELLPAVAKHSKSGAKQADEDVIGQIKLLSPERQYDYLMRLARNEPGLSRFFVRELRELGRQKSDKTAPEAEHVAYATLAEESRTLRAEEERRRQEIVRQAHLRRMKDLHDNQETYWKQVESLLVKSSSSGYDEATRILVDLRDAAREYNELEQFHAHLQSWARAYMRRPSFLKRLETHGLPVPKI